MSALPWPVWLMLPIVGWLVWGGIRDWRFPEVKTASVGKLVYLRRGARGRSDLWLVFDPRRDRILSNREIGYYAHGDNRWLVVAEVDGRRVRFSIDDSRVFRLLER